MAWIEHRRQRERSRVRTARRPILRGDFAKYATGEFFGNNHNLKMQEK